MIYEKRMEELLWWFTQAVYRQGNNGTAWYGRKERGWCKVWGAVILDASPGVCIVVAWGRTASTLHASMGNISSLHGARRSGIVVACRSEARSLLQT